MKKILPILVLFIFIPQIHAFTWQDLWVTKNHQGQAMMDAGQFTKAQDTFEDPAWAAAAAYRAGHYKEAAARYQSLKNNPDAWYNQGNALAKNNQLKLAIKAYDEALANDPDNQDALHNRKIVEQLLKEENEKKKNQNKPDQNKQDQNKQDQDKQNQDKQDQNKQDQDKPEQDKQDQDKQEQEKKESPPKKPPQSKAEREAEDEQKRAKEQWLRLIPDDPGGLMREKFLRDYLSRQRGSS